MRPIFFHTEPQDAFIILIPTNRARTSSISGKLRETKHSSVGIDEGSKQHPSGCAVYLSRPLPSAFRLHYARFSEFPLRQRACGATLLRP